MTIDFKELQDYQNLIKKQLKKERRVDRKLDLLSIINQLTAGPRNIVQKEMIMIEATARGFTEEEIDNLLEVLKKDNIIYESSPGYIKKR